MNPLNVDARLTGHWFDEKVEMLESSGQEKQARAGPTWELIKCHSI